MLRHRLSTLAALITLLTLWQTPGCAQKRNADYEAYIKTYATLAVEQMKAHAIPASITLAQGLLESGAGKSELVKKGNNHFGIKCHGWTGRTQYHNDDEENECFRAYKNAKESYEDHSQFLKRSRYQRLFTYKTTDYKAWAHGLKACGYATSPTYAQNLISIIERYELYKYDKANLGKYALFADEVRFINEKPYILARRGDTFKSISARVDVSERKLASYNELDRDALLCEGDIIFLKKKARKGEKSLEGKYYVVRQGDSMYTISQMFGIRLKRLYTINNMKPDDDLRIGQQIFLR